ncbi:MAG TPA: hypothetical protein VFB27_08305 [Opitutaceae bacterium]|nr:hypothetical protein [Opitutaceae bacterium]
MGLFDRFTAKKDSSANGQSAEAPAGSVQAQLSTARQRLEAKDVPGALAIYEQVLAEAGDRADVLVAISGDLGLNGEVRPIIDLIAPRYDAQRHGPATGLNVLQAYLAIHDITAAQHVLDILFSLNRPELEDRLHGFSNAIAELLEAERRGVLQTPPSVGLDGESDAPPPPLPHINLVSISKPIWFYGLEPMSAEILPPKEGRLRRVAFGQLALPGAKNVATLMAQPEDELGRLSRALPLWLAETFYFSPLYASHAAVGLMDDGQGGKHYALFSTEWTAENLRELAGSAHDPIDYLFTGALRLTAAGEYDLLLRVWEMKKIRERKTFAARWTAATADAELTKLHESIRAFMEWKPETRGLVYAPPARPRAWLDALGASLGLFLLEKNLLPKSQVPTLDALAASTAQMAGASEAAALALITLRSRAAHLGLAAPAVDSPLPATPVVEHARHAVE